MLNEGRMLSITTKTRIAFLKDQLMLIMQLELIMCGI